MHSYIVLTYPFIHTYTWAYSEEAYSYRFKSPRNKCTTETPKLNPTLKLFPGNIPVYTYRFASCGLVVSELDC